MNKAFSDARKAQREKEQKAKEEAENGRPAAPVRLPPQVLPPRPSG